MPWIAAGAGKGREANEKEGCWKRREERKRFELERPMVGDVENRGCLPPLMNDFKVRVVHAIDVTHAVLMCY